VELDFWNGLTGGDGPYMVKLIERFNSQNENINVKMSAIEWDVFYQKLPSAISVGRGPQVALMQSFYVPTFAARNIIMPLDDVAQSLGLKASDFTPAVWEAGAAVRHPVGRVALRALLQQYGYGERWFGSRQTAADWG
jgi:multiple sugar transport system substrate-binding protein